MSKHVQPQHDRFQDRMRRAKASRAENLDDALAERRAERLAEACVDEGGGVGGFFTRMFTSAATTIAREHARIAALPFPVVGLDDVLGDNHKHCGTLGLHFEPEPVAAGPEIVGMLMRGGHADWRFVEDDASFERTGMRSNRELRRTFHTLATTVLPDIVKAYGIHKITVYNRRG